MKTPSKLDQARAMREARFGVEPTRPAVMIAGPATNPAPRKASKAATVSDTVSWLAPEGKCPSCDKRRAALKATMRKRRARKAGS